MGFILEVYQTKTGTHPFNKWLLELRDIKARQKIRVRLERLGLGNLGDCKSIENGINELKLDFGPGYRIYFAYKGLQHILLLCAGSKRTQKNDIIAAKKYFIDYKMRGKHDAK